jgi:uracil-DNA glycosylase family 4
MNNPNANKLLELLRDSREQARFLGELGVETVTLANSVEAGEQMIALRLDETAEPSSAPRPSQIVTSDSYRPQIHPVSKRSSATIEAPQDSLFDEPAPAQAPFNQARETLEDVWRDIGDCTRCGLCEGRTQVVNTHGNRNARLMFVGEAPGADEDAQGKPFVGRAGQLLTKMIEAMGMKREDVIIGNVNRCRPPGNRQPTLEEAAICRPFLFREIAAIKPEVIVVMGNTALRNLLELREGITRVRGQFRDFRGIKVMPTFHPAYLLRDPSKKRETWEDLKKVMDYLDSNPPESES